MPASRIPVEIVRVQNGNGNLRMVPHVQLGELMRHPDLDVQKEMDALVTRYSAVIMSAKEILSAIESRRRETGRTVPSLYWELGDLLNGFIESNEGSLIFLNGIKGHFTRDLAISGASWKKILRLRYLVPSKDLIDDTRSWKFYRDAPSERIRSAVGPTRQIGRKLVGQEPVADHPTQPLLDQMLFSGASAQEPVVDRASSLRTHDRSRIEVHLPPEALSKLRELARHLDLSIKHPEAAVARALLMSILDEETRGSVQFRELLSRARNLPKRGSNRGRRVERRQNNSSM